MTSTFVSVSIQRSWLVYGQFNFIHKLYTQTHLFSFPYAHRINKNYKYCVDSKKQKNKDISFPTNSTCVPSYKILSGVKYLSVLELANVFFLFASTVFCRGKQTLFRTTSLIKRCMSNCSNMMYSDAEFKLLL